jgi:hypothetical protein
MNRPDDKQTYKSGNQGKSEQKKVVMALTFVRRRATSARISNRILDQPLHLSVDMAHRRLSDKFDGDLHSNGKPLVNLACDVLDGSLCNVGQGLFRDSIAGEHFEIRLGNDLELYPGNFAEHDGKFLVELDNDKDAICIGRVQRSMQAMWKCLPLWKSFPW